MVKKSSFIDILSDESDEDYFLEITNSSQKAFKQKKNTIPQETSKKCSLSNLPTDIKKWFRKGETLQESKWRQNLTQTTNPSHEQVLSKFNDKKQSPAMEKNLYCSVNLGTRVTDDTIRKEMEGTGDRDDISLNNMPEQLKKFENCRGCKKEFQRLLRHLNSSVSCAKHYDIGKLESEVKDQRREKCRQSMRKLMQGKWQKDRKKDELVFRQIGAEAKQEEKKRKREEDEQNFQKQRAKEKQKARESKKKEDD